MSLRKHLISFSALIMYWAAASGQTPLNRTIPVEVRGQRLEQVLEILSNRGNCYFSYNSNIIPRDSLVTLSASNKTVGQVLAQLPPGAYEFRERGNYIILQPAAEEPAPDRGPDRQQGILPGHHRDHRAGLQPADHHHHCPPFLRGHHDPARGLFRAGCAARPY